MVCPCWNGVNLCTVRSAYGVALQVLREGQQNRDRGNSSDISRMSNFWKSIWKMQCPSKIKHFLWRACKNILPTNDCLVRRKVGTMDGCVYCGEKETSGHTLWNCREAAEVWKESGIKIPHRVSLQRDFIDILWLMREYALDTDWELFATTAWGNWPNQ